LSHCHADHVGNDNHHNEHVETLAGHKFKHFFPVLALRFVILGRVDIYFVKQTLELDPLFLFFVEKLVLVFFLGDVKVHTHDGYE